MSRTARITIWILSGIGVLLALALLAAVAARLYVTTDSGRRWLLSQIEQAASGPEQTLAIGGLQGDPLSDFRLENIRLSDPEGQWLAVNSVAAEWSPWALLGGTLKVGHLAVDGVDLARLPAGGGEQETSSGGLPQLPVDLILERFEFTDIVVAQAAVGTDAVLAAEGNARFVEGEGYGLDISGRRTDRDDGSLQAALHYDPDRDLLDVDVALDAPAGGVITNLLGVPGLPALALNINGDGPLSNWQGSMEFRAGQESVVDIDITAAQTDRADIRISGTIDPRPFARVPMFNAAFDVSGRLHVREQILEIESLALDGPPSSLRLFGSINRERSAMDLIFQFQPRDMASLNELTAPARLGETALDGRLSGPFDDPNLSLNILSDSVQVSGVAAENLFLSVMARRDGEDFTISGTGGMDSLHYEDTRLAGAPTLLLDARLPGDFSSLHLDNVTVRAPDGEISASGDVSLTGGPLDIMVTAEIGAAERGEGAIAQLLRPGLDASASIAQQDGENPLRISDISLRHPWVMASGQASFEEGRGNELGSFDIRVTDVASLASVFDAPLSGEDIRIDATVGNSWTQPRLTAHVQSERLTAGGADFDNLDLRIENRPGEGGAQSGNVTLDAISPLGETGLALDYSVPGQGPIMLSSVSLDTTAGTLAGGFTVPRDGTPITGSLGGMVTVGPEVQEQVGIPLRGNLDLSLEANDMLGTQAVVVTVGGQDVFLGPVELASLTAEALRTADSIDFSLDASGHFRGEAQLNVSGSYSSSEGRQNLMVRTLDIQAASHSLRLENPVRITKVPERVEIEPLTLALDDGSMDVSLRQTAGEFALNLDLHAVPLDLADLAQIPVAVTGSMSGKVDLSAQGESAEGSIELTLDDMALRGGTAQVTSLNGSINGTWDGNRLSLMSQISGGEDRTIGVTAALPLVYQPDSGGISVPQDGPLSVEGTWQAEIAPLWRAVGSDADFLTGLLDATFSVAGTVGTPRISGQFNLRNGSYHNVDFGTVLNDVTADISLTPGQATIGQVSAVGQKGGSFSASGTVDFPAGAPPAVDMNVQFDKLQAMSRPDVTAIVTGELRYQLQDRKSTLSGMVTTNNVEARLINTVSSEVLVLDVREVPAPLRQAGQGTTGPGESPPMQLDIDVHIPQQLFIRGRGLDSEWQGDLKVSGPSDDFRLIGNVSLLRGNFTFAGKRFILTQGDVRFNGNQPINPDVNIRAEYEASDFTAIINIGGTARDIDISFSSNPAMPEDEILSNVLFEKGVDNLSALEAVQLASAMRSLATGGGGGLVGSARSALGLDVLSFGSADEGGGTVVRGGKYITDNVYIEVQSGTEPGSEKVGVQVEVTDNLSVESYIVDQTGGDIGLYWKKDY